MERNENVKKLDSGCDFISWGLQVDQGEKPASGDFWSTFLKARLVCGRPHEPLTFHRLEDAFVFREAGQAEATLYGVFSSPW